jgi:hypothetical protein
MTNVEAKAAIEAAREVAIEIVDPNWVYQTTINSIRVTVRKVHNDSTANEEEYSYAIKAEQEVSTNVFELCTKYHDDMRKAIAMADILRDIYYYGLEADLLWH